MSRLSFGLALGLALALVPTTVTALPTPIPRSASLVADHHQMTARNGTIAALENIPTMTALVSYQQTSEVANRQDGENCIIRNGQRECLNPHGGKPCELYPSRKCPPPKKGNNPGGGGPGHNATVPATAQDPTATQGPSAEVDRRDCAVIEGRKNCWNPGGTGKPCELYPSRKCPPPKKKKGGDPGGGGHHNATLQATAQDPKLITAQDVVAAAAKESLTDGAGHIEQGATHREPDITESVELDEAATAKPSASASGASLVKVPATVGPENLDDGGGGCIWVGNVRKCGRKYGPPVNPCEQYPSRKCPPAKKKGGSPGGGPGHNATAQGLSAAQTLATAADVVATKGFAIAPDLTAKRLGTAMDSTGGSKGVELHRSVTEEATATKKNNNTAAAEPTLVESLVKGRLNIETRTGKSGQCPNASGERNCYRPAPTPYDPCQQYPSRKCPSEKKKGGGGSSIAEDAETQDTRHVGGVQRVQRKHAAERGKLLGEGAVEHSQSHFQHSERDFDFVVKAVDVPQANWQSAPTKVLSELHNFARAQAKVLLSRTVGLLNAVKLNECHYVPKYRNCGRGGGSGPAHCELCPSRRCGPEGKCAPVGGNSSTIDTLGVLEGKSLLPTIIGQEKLEARSRTAEGHH